MHGTWLVLFVVLWVAVIALGLIVLGVDARVTTLLRDGVSTHQQQAPPGPAVGARLPDLLASAKGETGLDGFGGARVLLFLGSTCAPCRRLGERLSEATEGVLAHATDEVDFVVITDTGGSDLFGSIGGARVIEEPDGDLSKRMGVRVTPYGLAVDAAGSVRASGVPHGSEDVEGLFRSAQAAPPSEAGLLSVTQG